MDKRLKPCPVCKTTEHPKSTNKGYLCRPCAVERVRKWQIDNPERRAFYHKKRTYGVDEEEYLGKLVRQGNKCKICLQPETSVDKRTGKTRMLSIDHCHTTGKVRDLLCFRCNVTLGKVEENKELLQRMINYLYDHD